MSVIVMIDEVEDMMEDLDTEWSYWSGVKKICLMEDDSSIKSGVKLCGRTEVAAFPVNHLSKGVMRNQLSELADDSSQPLDSHLPISSRLSQTLQNASHLSILLAVLILLQLIHNLLSFLEDLTDSLVVIPHCGLNLNEMNVLLHDKVAGIEFVDGSWRRQVDGVLEVWELGLDVVV
jgi:hypothetical protein